MAKPEKRMRNGKVRWYARYRDPDGKQRAKAFDRQVDAQAFLDDLHAAMRRGRYLDPDAGRVTFKTYADTWVAQQTFDESTREAVEGRLKVHVLPILGGHPIGQIRPSAIQAWLRTIDHLAPTYQRTIFANVNSILGAAVDDEQLGRNPAQAGSVRAPRLDVRRITPWTSERVLAVRDALPDRYGILATLGAGLGVRQGEAFGLSPDDVDFLRGVVTIRRQVKIVRSKQVFALPKGRKVREVPLPASVRDPLAAYLAATPAQQVTLPWETSEGDAVTVPLVVSTRERSAVNRNYFNGHIWKPALAVADVPDARQNGMHALRHFYASTLLHDGVSINAVADFLGHADPGFTLRVYGHLMPGSEDRARSAVDGALAADNGDSAASGT